MSNYTPPTSKKLNTIDDVPVTNKPNTPVVSPVTPMVKPVTTASVESCNLCVDLYIEALAPGKRLTDLEKANAQIGFISTITKSIQFNYNDYCAFMEYLMKTVKENPAAFSMERRYLMLSLVDAQTLRPEAKTRYMNYIDAVITLTNNISQRHRVARLVDIPSLVRGLTPAAQQNITTYFNSLYQ